MRERKIALGVNIFQTIKCTEVKKAQLDSSVFNCLVCNPFEELYTEDEACDRVTVFSAFQLWLKYSRQINRVFSKETFRVERNAFIPPNYCKFQKQNEGMKKKLKMVCLHTS